MPMAFDVAGAVLRAHMLKGKPCHDPCPADRSVLPALCAVVQRSKAGGVLEQWTGFS